MFQNVRRGAVGLGGIVAVALVLAAYLGTAGAMWKAYSDGGASQVGAEQCAVVCAKQAAPSPKG